VVSRVLKVVVALFTVALPVVGVATSAGAAGTPTRPAGASATTPGPNDFLGWVNTLRAHANDAPLTANAGLTSVAQSWANHMASTEVLAHNPNLSTQAPSGWTKMGENIGNGYSLAAVYNALVASPDHYANMVDKTYNRTGVGVATDSRGQVWVAEDFGDYPPPMPSTLVFPTNGDRIFSSSQAFSWSMTPGATNYDLMVGTTQGGYDILNTGLLPNSQLSYTVPALPANQTLWARIYTYAQGIWTWNDAYFTVV
jgi:Cysteine-rich secretory protein family